MNNMRKVIVVAGPTASGKSDFAVKLALERNGEIVSADSRQIYRGLDIGTGKITRKEMRGVPHHMLDVIGLHEAFSVAEYKRTAQPVLEDILSRGKTPIICGGTGQYIDALIYDIPLPPVPPNTDLRNSLQQKTSDELYEDLKKKDPARAAGIDRHNKVRLIRALEIVASEGKVPALPEPTPLYDIEFYLMSPSRELLRERITRRLQKRLAQGMVEEVKEVMKKGFTSETMKRFGLEYVTIGRFLEGSLSEEEMKAELVTTTMQYAKRQDMWNKKYLSFARLVEVN